MICKGASCRIIELIRTTIIRYAIGLYPLLALTSFSIPSDPLIRLFFSMPIINPEAVGASDASLLVTRDYVDVFLSDVCACVRACVRACMRACIQMHSRGRVWESSQVTGLTNNARFRCAVVVDDFFTSRAHHASPCIFCVPVRHSCTRARVCVCVSSKRNDSQPRQV